MDINQKLTEELNVKRWQIDAAVNLIDEGNTIPFISRYRKEVTGSLNDEQLRKLDERLKYLRNLEEKKEQVISSINEQGKLTDELKPAPFVRQIHKRRKICPFQRFAAAVRKDQTHRHRTVFRQTVKRYNRITEFPQSETIQKHLPF